MIYFLLLILFFNTQPVPKSQVQSGKVSYQLYQNTYFNKAKYPDGFVKKFELFFDDNVSFFNNYADTTLSAGIQFRQSKSSKKKPAQIAYFKSLQTGEMIEQFTHLPLITTYVVEKIPVFDWQFENQSKMIGNFRCLKATAKFRGRQWTAWYAPEIPVSHGPWKLHGLPGLILQAHDESNEVQFMMQSIEIPFAGISSKINFEKTGIETNFEVYKNDPENFWMSEANRVLNEQNQGKGKINLTSNPVFAPIELDFE